MRKKRISIYLSFLMILTSLLKGDISAAHKLGEALGKEVRVDFNESHLKKDFIPGYVGDTPPETSFAQRPFTEMEKAGTDKLWSSEENTAGEFITSSQKNKKKIEIDPTTDPLFIEANKIIDKPAESLKTRTIEREEEAPTKEYHKCYEATEPVLHKCVMKRVVKLRPIEDKKHLITVTGRGVEEYHRYKGGGQSWSHYHIPSVNAFDTALEKRNRSAFMRIDRTPPFPRESVNIAKSFKVVEGPLVLNSNYDISHHSPSSCKCAVSGIVEIIYKPKPTEADLIETIEDTCAPLEKLTEEGMCRYGEETIHEGSATKELEGVRVERDWWHKERTYICGYDSKNDCDTLRAKGCVQIDSKCHVERDGNCLEREQTYACIKYLKNKKITAEGEVPFCLTGDCTDQSWNPNQDMVEALSKLSLLNELQKDINQAFKDGSKSVVNIFRGNSMSCSKHFMNFSDCCGLKSGWGEQLRLTKCLPDERLLSDLRKAGRCHMIGTYVAEKGPIGWIRKKTTFCCFESKLARAIQQQARGQLGIGWGSVEAPNCRPLTIQEFTRVDFKRINFSEVFSDVMSKVKVPDAHKMATQLKEDWMKRLPTEAELKGKKLAQNAQMKEQIDARHAQIKTGHAGGYSLHGTPPYQKDPEEAEAKVVL